MRPPHRPPAAPGPRRALSNVGGPAEREGDPTLADALADALEQAEDPDEARRHIHGFHSYPARLHPTLARNLLRRLCPAAGSVLDPFCGSGTVLVEARLLGRRAAGVDLNPLAVRLARLKARGRDEAYLRALLDDARRVAAVAADRRKKKAGASRRYPPEDVAAFAPHVLLELDSLRVGIEISPSAQFQADLGLILSSLLTKLSLRAGDSAERQVPKRIAAGFASRMFVARTEELLRQFDEFSRLIPPDTLSSVDVFEADARDLRVLGEQRFELVLTSPPYPGNYDYLHHHERRLRWLNLDASSFARNEVGARRLLETEPSEQQARSRWLADLGLMLAQIRDHLTPGGVAVFILADSVVRGVPFYNDDLLLSAARSAGLRLVARASQPRPHFHAPSRDAFLHRPRREHAIALALPPPGSPDPRAPGSGLRSHAPPLPAPPRSEPRSRPPQSATANEPTPRHLAGRNPAAEPVAPPLREPPQRSRSRLPEPAEPGEEGRNTDERGPEERGPGGRNPRERGARGRGGRR